jgi:hypothetical protein
MRDKERARVDACTSVCVRECVLERGSGMKIGQSPHYPKP